MKGYKGEGAARVEGLGVDNQTIAMGGQSHKEVE
jgi:hypothetical protein